MSTVGIITEYNPFHHGHLYHIQKAKELTGADTVIAVMSGDFVQRGEPAIMDKYSRAFIALNNGVNLITALPVFYSCSSAESFSYGAIMTLKELGADYLCFGSECGDLSLLSQLADIFLREPKELSSKIKQKINAGLSYPLARSEALISYLKQTNSNHDISTISKLISSPNNILGIEYLKIIQKYHLSMKPVTLPRVGSNYHDSAIYNSMPSASAVRNMLNSLHEAVIDDMLLEEQLNRIMPPNAIHTLTSSFHKTFPIVPDDFSLLLNIKLKNILYSNAESLTDYVDMNEHLANRLSNQFTEFDNFSTLSMALKSKQITYSRISRCLFHILLEITKNKIPKYEINHSVPYIRILGFDSLGQQHLGKIRKSQTVPVIIKTADYKELMQEDLFASDIYRMAVFHKYQMQMLSDLKRPPIILR